MHIQPYQLSSYPLADGVNIGHVSRSVVLELVHLCLQFFGQSNDDFFPLLWRVEFQARDDAEAVERFDGAAHWFRDAGVRVPEVYSWTARGLLVQDAGDRLLADHADDANLESLYAEAAQIIVALGAAIWAFNRQE